MSETKHSTPGMLEMTRDLPAPVERVWRAFTQPEALARWGVGQRYENICLDLDLRIGGALYHRVRAKQTQTPWTFFGVYQEIEPQRRLIYSFDWKTDWRGPSTASRLELQFAEHGGGTQLHLLHSELMEPAMQSTQEHWSEFLDLLDEMLRGGLLR